LNASYSIPSGTPGISGSLSAGLNLGGAALLTAWANSTSNALLKAALQEAAIIAAAMPA
jgi:hypothetical protein